MRAFALLSFAAAAFAAPAIVAPGLANVVAPVGAVVDSVTYANTKAHVDGYASVGNVDAKYNYIGNGVLNNNDVNIASRSTTVKNVGVKNVPVVANAKNPDVDVLSHNVHTRAVVDVLAVVTAVLEALVKLATKLNVDAEAAIANINLNYNYILNNVGNGNKINILKRATVEPLVQAIAAVLAVVRACLKAGVNANVIIATIQATCNKVANNAGNGNVVNVAQGVIADTTAPIVVVINAFVVAVTHVCAGLTLEVLNVALQYNSILNNVLDNNTISILSGN